MNYLIIAGLGNPGEKYKNTRHNIGFMVIDKFKEKNNLPEFKITKKYNSLIIENDFEGKKIILVKPQTFMNESGGPIVKIIKNHRIQTINLIVAHDDIDLPLGKIKISMDRGSAGHKGVESIIKRLKTENLIRVRVGIFPSQEKPKNPEEFVLQTFSKEEKEILKEAIEKSVAALGTIIKDGPVKAMNFYN